MWAGRASCRVPLNGRYCSNWSTSCDSAGGEGFRSGEAPAAGAARAETAAAIAKQRNHLLLSMCVFSLLSGRRSTTHPQADSSRVFRSTGRRRVARPLWCSRRLSRGTPRTAGYVGRSCEEVAGVIGANVDSASEYSDISGAPGRSRCHVVAHPDPVRNSLAVLAARFPARVTDDEMAKALSREEERPREHDVRIRRARSIWCCEASTVGEACRKTSKSTLSSSAPPSRRPDRRVIGAD